jgi:hypothetical protein
LSNQTCFSKLAKLIFSVTYLTRRNLHKECIVTCKAIWELFTAHYDRYWIVMVCGFFGTLDFFSLTHNNKQDNWTKHVEELENGDEKTQQIDRLKNGWRLREKKCKILVVHHKFVEYHRSNGLNNSPTVGEFSHPRLSLGSNILG